MRTARELFAERGYAGATTRSIATRAGVDPALIVHFFGGKDELFATTSLRPAGFLTALLEGFAEGPGEVGERLALAYLGPWETAATAAPLLATARSALEHEGAMDQLRTLLLPPSASRAVQLLGMDAPELRVALAMSHLYGVAMARHVIKLPALVAPSLEELVDAVAPAVQHYMTGPLTRRC